VPPGMGKRDICPPSPDQGPTGQWRRYSLARCMGGATATGLRLLATDLCLMYGNSMDDNKKTHTVAISKRLFSRPCMLHMVDCMVIINNNNNNSL